MTKLSKPRNDLTGQIFGRLKVIEYLYTDKRSMYLCSCECGNNCVVGQSNLVSGHTRSCGCIRRENICSTINKTKKYSISCKKDRLYAIWASMKQRCYNNNHKQYKNYGGRGIKICELWLKDYNTFKRWCIANGYDYNADYGECTIDRINVNGDYETNNCRFITLAEQNRKKQNNISHVKKLEEIKNDSK